MDLALNKLQGLICYKTQPTNHLHYTFNISADMPFGLLRVYNVGSLHRTSNWTLLLNPPGVDCSNSVNHDRVQLVSLILAVNLWGSSTKNLMKRTVDPRLVSSALLHILTIRCNLVSYPGHLLGQGLTPSLQRHSWCILQSSISQLSYHLSVSKQTDNDFLFKNVTYKLFTCKW